MSTAADEYERGKQEGRNEARLDEAFVRLNKINGSVERHAKSNEALARTMSDGFEKVTNEIRQMQEDARVREAGVRSAAEALANENQRRREEDEALREERARALEVPVRKWGIRANKASVIYLFVTLLLGLATIYFAVRPI